MAGLEVLLQPPRAEDTQLLQCSEHDMRKFDSTEQQNKCLDGCVAAHPC